MDLQILSAWRARGPVSRFTLTKLGVTGPKLKNMIKYEIVVEERDALTNLPVYRVNDDIFG